jgi:predicted hotdog family 3-hydroxylacyl-ACP dehydratase
MSGRPPSLDRAGIAARIPHQDRMCLLERVDDWSEVAIHCRAISHRDAANPLREAWGLPATAAIEYAAQAMAVHGTLLAAASETPRPGYLASVRGVALRVARLDTIADELDIRAERVTGNDDQILYRFTVAAAGEVLASGRATVILDAGLPVGATAGGPT